MTDLKSKTPKRKRRRTCWDRLRAKMLRSHRRRDPATSTVARLMALFTLIFGRMPPIPTVPAPAPYIPPPISLAHAHRIETARRLGLPSRYVDVALAHGAVPYTLLFDHMRRGGRSREDAMSVLRQRAPDSCRDWLDHVEQSGLWSRLLLCHVRHGADEDTDIRLLKSTLAWLEELNPARELDPADAETSFTPGTGRKYSDNCDDPDKPKTVRP